MKHLITLSLVASCFGAHAELVIKGVVWTAAGTVQLSVASGSNEPVSIEVSLKPNEESSTTNGLIRASVREWSATSDRERTVMSIVLRQDGGELASMYVLRETPDRQYEYVNLRPMLDPAASLEGDLKDILKGLRVFNQCSDNASLIALATYVKGRPDKQINQFWVEVEKNKIPKGENGQCAAIPDVPVPAADTTTTTAAGKRAPVKPAPPQPARAPRPRPTAQPQYDAYGNPIPAREAGPYQQRPAQRPDYGNGYDYPYGGGGAAGGPARGGYGYDRGGYSGGGGYPAGVGYGQGGGYGYGGGY